MPTQQLQFRGYIRGLDALRGLAIALVVVYHGIAGRTPWTEWHGLARGVMYGSYLGLTGVDLFFVLSGFLITGILADTSASPRFYRNFYRNRILRILPAYLLMLLVMLLAHVVNGRFIVAALLFVANMASIVGAHSTQYPSLWSLAVEEQFYLLWPTIVRRCSLGGLARGIGIYLVLSPFVRMGLAHLMPRVDMLYKLWGNADWLLAGGLVALALRTGDLYAGNIGKWLRCLVALFVASAPICLYRDLHQLSNYATNPFYRLPFLFLYVGLLLWVILGNSAPRAALASSWSRAKAAVMRVMMFLGYISYGLYLVHSFVFTELYRAAQGSWLGSTGTLAPVLASFTLGALLSVAIAWLSRRYFEEWFLHLKQKPHAAVKAAS